MIQINCRCYFNNTTTTHLMDGKVASDPSLRLVNAPTVEREGGRGEGKEREGQREPVTFKYMLGVGGMDRSSYSSPNENENLNLMEFQFGFE